MTNYKYGVVTVGTPSQFDIRENIDDWYGDKIFCHMNNEQAIEFVDGKFFPEQLKSLSDLTEENLQDIKNFVSRNVIRRFRENCLIREILLYMRFTGKEIESLNESLRTKSLQELREIKAKIDKTISEVKDMLIKSNGSNTGANNV